MPKRKKESEVKKKTGGQWWSSVSEKRAYEHHMKKGNYKDAMKIKYGSEKRKKEAMDKAPRKITRDKKDKTQVHLSKRYRKILAKDICEKYEVTQKEAERVVQKAIKEDIPPDKILAEKDIRRKR